MQYAIAAVFLAAVSLTLHFACAVAFGWALTLAVLVFIPLIPVTLRLSRTLWIYWDNRVDPQQP